MAKPLTLVEKISMITPYNVRNYIEGTYYKLKAQNAFSTEKEMHINQQALRRASLCSTCLDNQSCLYCGCDTPDAFFAPEKYDSKTKWGPMLSKEDWEDFQKVNGTEYFSDNILYDSVNKKIIFVLSGIYEYMKEGQEFMFINFMKVSNPVITQNAFTVTITVDGTKKMFNKYLDNLKKIQEHYVDKQRGHVTVSDDNDPIIIDVTEKDFGTVIDGQKVVINYELYNNSNDVYSITNLELGCSCTSSSSLGNILLPKQKSKLEVIFDSKNKKGPVNKKVIATFTSMSDGKITKEFIFKGLVNN